MPPIPEGSLKTWLTQIIDSSIVLVFSKTTCPFCKKVITLFSDLGIKYTDVQLDKREDGGEIQQLLATITGQKTVPNVFFRGKHIGGCDKVMELHDSNKLDAAMTSLKYDYDLVVIGGGSGGLAASKEAANYGAKVAVLDYVVPTPLGTKWGLGGTCVNVGCIPKKLMHQAALLRYGIQDSGSFGWNIPQVDKLTHDWAKMVEEIQNHIGSLNFNYRVTLKEKKVVYINALGEFLDPHTIKATSANGTTQTITSARFILATGERPRYPGVPGDKEFCITSDDLFSLSYRPGKTLVIGASYVALECAGFLAALGMDVTVMVRSIFLRGFDQQMADLAGGYMAEHGVHFVRECVPTQIRQLQKGTPGLLEVTGEFVNSKEEFKNTYNTVILAIGRDPCTAKIGLDKLGLAMDKAGRVICNEAEHTNLPHVYAIGDIVSGKPQLTPVAIEAGRNLAARLYGADTRLTDYINIPTTVFTPLEYGCIGYAEEDAIKKFKQENIKVYHTYFKPLEWTVPHREDNACYCKLICLTSEHDRVVGLHVIGPNAGEITQGYAVALKLGATKADFDRTIGIHPTCSEVFTTLNITKDSGTDAAQAGC